MEYDGIKMGTSKNKTGSFDISIPSGTTTLYVHSAAWDGKSSTLSVTTTQTGVTITPNTAWSLTSDAGISGSSSTFTLSTPTNATTSYFKEYTLTGVTTTTTITIANGTERAVVWGINTASGSSTEPSISGTDPAELTCDATSGQIGYTITNGVSGGTVSASVPSGSWITVPNGTITDNPFTFTCTPNPNAAQRSETVTLYYTVTGDTDPSATTTVTVTQAYNPTGNGCEDDPFTVAEAIAATPASGMSEFIYVSGIVSDIVDPYSDQYHNISYTISADGATTGAQLEAFRGKGMNGDNFTSDQDILVGDEVTIYGQLQLYGTTYELASGNYLVYFNRPGGVTTYTLTTSVNLANSGSITCNPTGNNGEYNAGTSVQLTATPETGYVFENWTVDGTTASGNPLTITMDEDHTVVANFATAPTYTVTFNVGSEGTFVASADFPNTTNTVYAGEYTLPTATRTGYTFNGWLLTGSTTPITGSYTVSASVDFTADYTENTSVAGGTDCLDNASTGIAGTSYGEWTATGSSGAEYAGQSAGGTSTSGSCIQIRSSNSNSGIVTTKSGGKALKVSVEWNIANSSDRTLNIYGSNTAYTSPTELYGTNLVDELIGTIVYGTSTELNITGDYEYIGIRSASGAAYLDEICIEWGGASSVSAPTINGEARFVESQEITIDVPTGTEVYYTYGTTMPDPTASPIVGTKYTEPFTINGTTTVNAIAYDGTNTSSVTTATFTRVYTITLTQTAGGVISADVEQAAEGETVTLTATPNVGYSFGGWTADPASTTLNPNANTTPATFTMSTDNVTVTATFTTATAYTVLFNINGKVEMTATVNAGNTIDLSKFVADVTTDGHTFDGWYTAATGGEKKTGDFTPDADEVILYAQFAAASADNYALVTDASQLVAGNLVVIAASAYDNAMSTDQKSNNRGAFAITKESNTISWTPDSYTVCEFELRQGTITGTWSFFDANYSTAGGYLYAAGKSSKANPNYLRTEETLTDNSSWSVSINNNKASIVAQGENDINVMQYNTSSDGLFACYSSASQKDLALYTKPASTSGAKGMRVDVDANSKVTAIAADVLVTVKAGGIVYLTGANAGNSSNLVVEDGGQLVATNPVAATVHKSITGYPDVNVKSGYTLIASPMASTTFNNTANTNLATNNYDLYAYDPSQDLEWRNFKNTDNSLSTLNAGQGYLYANSNNLDLMFMGTTNIAISDVNGLPYVENNTIKSLYLAGNTLPHNQVFYVHNNSNENANFLTMNAAGNGFNTTTASSFEATPMQGFFVQAGGSGWTLSTTAPSTSAPSDQITPAPQINVKVKRMRGAVIDNAIVSLGNAPLMNKFMLNENATKIYVPMGNEEFAVVRAQAEGETPLCFKASENGNYIIAVELKDVEMNYLHLIDNMTGANVDLLATPSYSFEARTTDYTSRFRLVFSANDENGASTESETFAYYNGSEWVISNMGEATLQVVDVMGRVMRSTNCTDGACTVSTSSLVPGVYMLRLVNSDSVKTQKIVVR